MAYIKSEDLIKFIDEKGARYGLTSANICNFKELVRVFTNSATRHNACVVCNTIIPEGRQVCPSCENDEKI